MMMNSVDIGPDQPTLRVMRKPVKMRGQSKWKNRFVVASLKSWWKKKKREMRVWGKGGGGGEVKFYIIYPNDSG